MILVLILLLTLLGGYLGFRYTFVRSPDPDWEDPKSLENTMWKAYAQSIPKSVLWLRNHNAQDVAVTSFDGLTLRGKWVPAQDPKATVILCHGYRSSYLTDFGAIFELYHSMGLNLLMIRQRAHGESEGKYITFGVHERKDILSWIDFHNRVHGRDNVYLSGMSMGASTVLFAAGEDLPDNVRGITADCGFTSPYEIIGHVIKKDFHLPPKLLLPLLNLYARLLAGFDMRECHTRQILSRCQKPILMIHGAADDYVPCHMSQTGFDACASEKQLLIAPGAGHGTSFLYDRERILAALTAFFDQHISPIYQEVSK